MFRDALQPTTAAAARHDGLLTATTGDAVVMSTRWFVGRMDRFSPGKDTGMEIPVSMGFQTRQLFEVDCGTPDTGLSMQQADAYQHLC